MARKAALYRILVILGGYFFSFGAIGCPDGDECANPTVTQWCYHIDNGRPAYPFTPRRTRRPMRLTWHNRPAQLATTSQFRTLPDGIKSLGAIRALRAIQIASSTPMKTSTRFSRRPPRLPLLRAGGRRKHGPPSLGDMPGGIRHGLRHRPLRAIARQVSLLHWRPIRSDKLGNWWRVKPIILAAARFRWISSAITDPMPRISTRAIPIWPLI